MELAECSTVYGGVCQCQDGYFPLSGACEPLKDVGDNCTGTGQCQDPAQCSVTRGQGETQRETEREEREGQTDRQTDRDTEREIGREREREWARERVCERERVGERQKEGKREKGRE